MLLCCKFGIYDIHHIVEEICHPAPLSRTAAFYSISRILIFLRVEVKTEKCMKSFLDMELVRLIPSIYEFAGYYKVDKFTEVGIITGESHI